MTMESETGSGGNILCKLRSEETKHTDNDGISTSKKKADLVRVELTETPTLFMISLPSNSVELDLIQKNHNHNHNLACHQSVISIRNANTYTYLNEEPIVKVSKCLDGVAPSSTPLGRKKMTIPSFITVIQNDPSIYQCNICHRKFRTKTTIGYHKYCGKSNHDKPYKCKYDQCGKGYVRKQDYEYHLRTHTGERPFVCQCGRSYRKRSALTKHQRSLNHQVGGTSCSRPELEDLDGKTNELIIAPMAESVIISRSNSELKNSNPILPGESVGVVVASEPDSDHHVVPFYRQETATATWTGMSNCNWCRPCLQALPRHCAIEGVTPVVLEESPLSNCSYCAVRPFPCSTCGVRYRVKGALSSHIKINHNNSLDQPKLQPDNVMAHEHVIYKDDFYVSPTI